MWLMVLLAAAAAQTPEPSTADLGFMVGEWRLEGAFNPGTPQEVKETGTRNCAFAMDRAYVRCDWAMTNAKGRARQLVSYHNYNKLYGRFEHLFVASNWPTKVIGMSALERQGERRSMTIDMRFTLPDGREEHVRALQSHDGDLFTSDEQIRVGATGEWRTNTRFSGVRVR